MSEQVWNKAGNETCSVTIALPDCARHLARLRPGHPAAHHISNLIQQLKNYPLNPDALRPAILRSIERIEQSRSGRQGE